MVSGCEQGGGTPTFRVSSSGFITISGLHKVGGQGASAGRSVTPSRRVDCALKGGRPYIVHHCLDLLQAPDSGVELEGVAGEGNVVPTDTHNAHR